MDEQWEMASGSLGTIDEVRANGKELLLDYLSSNGTILVPRVHQGHMTVRGLLKQENQDRVVTCVDLRNPGRHVQAAPRKRSSRARAAAAACASSHPAVSYCAVFDGHGGTHASSVAAERLQHIVSADAELHKAFDAWLLGDHSGHDRERLQTQWNSAFAALDKEILELSQASGHMDGTTAVAGVHVGPCLITASAGDSRAVLARGGTAMRLTNDHTPDRVGERERIESVGGHIKFIKGSWRVILPDHKTQTMKICACSRGLGDADFKANQLISSVPEVQHTVLIPRIDTASIFASDGVWNYVDDQAAVDVVTSTIAEYAEMRMALNLTAVAQAAAKKLVKKALDCGSVDDISVIVNVYDYDAPGEQNGTGNSTMMTTLVDATIESAVPSSEDDDEPSL